MQDIGTECKRIRELLIYQINLKSSAKEMIFKYIDVVTEFIWSYGAPKDCYYVKTRQKSVCIYIVAEYDH
jgi:hypothetical protein